MKAKAKLVFKQDGTVKLETIENAKGPACTKVKEAVKQLLPGAVDPGSEHKTNDYYKTTEGKTDIEVGG